MSKTTETSRQQKTASNKTSRKSRWNVFGLRKEDHRDPAALTFARLGLLAYRW